MKQLYLLALILPLSTAMFAQSDQWKQYVNYGTITSLASDDSLVDAGSSNGLIKVERFNNYAHFVNSTTINLPEVKIMCLYREAYYRLNRVYAGTEGEGLLVINNYGYSLYSTNTSNILSDTVYGIADDPYSNLWLATPRGISKMNRLTYPIDFENYNMANSGLPSSNTNCVEVQSNYKWIGSDAGLTSFNDTDWATYNANNSPLPCDTVTCISAEPGNGIWIGTYDGGLVHYYNGIWTVYDTSNSPLTSNHITSLSTLNGNTRWIGTVNGINRLMNNQWTSWLTNEHVTAVTTDNSNEAWIGTITGTIHKFHSGVWSIVLENNPQLPTNLYRDVTTENIGVRWFATENNGLLAMYGSAWSHFTMENSPLPEDKVRALDADEYNIWVGTWGGGIVKIGYDGWTNYTSGNSGIPDNTITSIKVQSPDTIWLGTYGSGLGELTPDHCNIYNMDYIPLMPNNTNNCLTIDNNGVKWIGYSQGLMRYDGNEWMLFDVTNSGLPSNIIFDIAINPIDNNVWCATQAGLAEFDGFTWNVYNTGNSGLSGNEIRSLAFDNTGTCWIGTHYNGLISYKDNIWTVYDQNNSGITNPFIRAIAIDIYGNKWLATAFGITAFNENGVYVSTANKINQPSALKIWPNPSNEIINFEVPASRITESAIFTLQGRLVNKMKGNQSSILIKSLPKGIYILKVTTPQGSEAGRFVKL